eukprot:4362110-Karenia_brevis.AAC.1
MFRATQTVKTASLLTKNNQKSFPRSALVCPRRPSVREAPLSCALAASPRPLARTTQTRNEIEIDFAVQGMYSQQLTP